MNSAVMFIADCLLWAGLAVLVVLAVEELIIDVGRYMLFSRSWGTRDPQSLTPAVERDRLFASSAESTQPVRLAILMPAWCEDAVLGRSVSRLLENVDHGSCELFIGCWQNDLGTRDEAGLLKSRFANVHALTLGTSGPAPTADAINALVRRALDFELQDGREFDGLLILHPGESPHPLCLNVLGQLLREHDMVRVPILASVDDRLTLTGGHLADSLSVQHLRELPVRASLCEQVAGGGLALAISRTAACQAIARNRGRDLLDATSTVSDYDLANQLTSLGRSNIYGRVVTLRKEPGPIYARAVAIRRRLPRNFDHALRYRTRRVAGLMKSAFTHLVSSSSRDVRAGFWRKFALIRDIQTVPFAVVLGMAGLGVIALTAQSWIDGNNPWQWWSTFGDQTPGFNVLIIAALFGVVSHFVHRLVASVRVYGSARWFLVLPNYLWGLVFELLVAWHVVGNVVNDALSSRRRAKNSHLHRRAPASVDHSEPLRPARLGGILVERGLITTEQLNDALSQQHALRRPLGRILKDDGRVEESSLLEALSTQLSMPVADIHALSLPARLGLLLPTQLMFEHRVFPIHVDDDGQIELVCYRKIEPADVFELEEAAGHSVSMRLARRGEVRQAIRLYKQVSDQFDSRALAGSTRTLGELSMMMRKASRPRNSWKKPVGQRGLGDYLVIEGFLEADTLKLCVQEAARRSQSLGDYLVNQGFLTESTLDEVIQRMRRVRGIQLATVEGKRLPGTESLVEIPRVQNFGGDDARVTP